MNDTIRPEVRHDEERSVEREDARTKGAVRRIARTAGGGPAVKAAPKPEAAVANTAKGAGAAGARDADWRATDSAAKKAGFKREAGKGYRAALVEFATAHGIAVPARRTDAATTATRPPAKATKASRATKSGGRS